MAIFSPTTVSELIETIETANGNGEANVIELVGGTRYTLTAVNNTTAGGDPNGLPIITGEITIEGKGAIIEREDSAPSFRIFRIASTGDLTLNDLTIEGGDTFWSGGGIYNDNGTLTLEKASIFDNHSAEGAGGGIYAEGGTVVIAESTIAQNDSKFEGGGIRGTSGNLVIRRSIIYNNETGVNNPGGSGGGIKYWDGAVTIDDSFISNNTAVISGGVGGIEVIRCDLKITGSRVIGNRGLWVGGVWARGTRDGNPPQIKIEYCEIAGNTATDPSGNGGMRFSGSDNQQVNVHHCSIHGNSHVSVYNAPDAPRADATYNWWGDPDGPSVTEPYLEGDSISSNIDYGPFYPVAECSQTGPGGCGEMGVYASSDNETATNPISLYKGEKRVEVTDLTLNTPAGPLSFTRTYRQSKQAEWNIMGLGWTHNHAISLAPIAGTPNTIVVRMPHGGDAHFTETEPGSNQYVGDAGATSSITWNSGTQQYTLTTADQSVYVFDDGGKLLSRSWPAGETWTYSYSGSQLIQVIDAYGNKLVFRYYTSGAHDGQLYRVGDQTFDDTDPNNPTGRYIEFGYGLNKIVDPNSGAIVDGSASLLTSVQDVRGETWTYTYYADTDQHADVRQLNFLIKRESPSVDTDGDLVADRVLTLEEVSYTMQGEDLAEDGGMELSDLDTPWQGITGAEPVTNTRSQGQVDEPDYARYVVGDAAGEGIEGNMWDLVDGLTYIVTARVYPASGTVKMQVTGSTDFDRDTGGSTGAWQTLRVVHQASAGASDVKLQFIASGGAAEFYVDAVSVIETDLSVAQITQDRGEAGLVTDLTFPSVVGTATTETIAATDVTTTHLFFGGVHVGTIDPLGNEQGRDLNTVFRPQAQRDANNNETLLAWSTGGKRLEQVTDALNHTTQFDYNPADDTLNYSLDDEGRKTQYIYGETPRQPSDVKVIDSDGTTVLRWQKFDYDPKGRTLVEKTVDPANGTTELQKVTRTYYPDTPPGTPGAGLLESVTQIDVEQPANNKTTWYTYDEMGRVIKTQQSSLLGTCQFSYSVYDAAGNVLATVCGRQNTTPPTTVAEALAMYTSDPDHTHVTTYEYDTLGRRVETTVNAGAPFAQTALTFYDALGRVWRTIANYHPQGSSVPGDWEWNDAPDKKRWEDGAGNAISPGSDNTENIMADTEYNALGLVRLRRDALGLVTLYGYDNAGRLVKTVQNAATPEHNNDWIGTDPNPADPSLENYPYPPHTLSDASDKDLITEQFYDAAGNLVKVVDATGQVSFAVYDPLNRPWRTLRSAKDDATIDLNPGEPNYSAANDPRLPVEGEPGTVYVPGLDPDRDLIEETEYDNMGRVVQTRRLLDTRGGMPQWTATRYVYDELDRQVRTIASYVPQGDPETDPADWAWDANDGRWEQTDGTPIDHGNNDQNLITEAVYDTAGRVQETIDVNRSRTRTVYDGLGRQRLTITNYVPQSASDPADWVWNGQWTYDGVNAVSFGDHHDQNIIAETTYDADGRVKTTRDVEGKLTRHVYDEQGRQKLAIVNYVAQGDPVVEPEYWGWDAVDGRWEDGSGSAIDRTSTYFTDKEIYDINVVAETIYDAQGRVQKTRDVRGDLTFYGYDSAGRQVKTVQNASNTGYDVDADPDLSGYAPAGGAGADQDRITTTTYDLVGRVGQAVDAAGVVMVYVYDALGRRVRTIANYVAQGTTDPANWVWDETDQRWEDGSSGNAIGHNTAFDQNLITDTVYNKAGQVLRTIANWTGDGLPDEQVAGEWTFVPGYNDGAYNDRNRIIEYVYDSAGRRVKVTDPVGSVTTTVYLPSGQTKEVIGPEGVITRHAYDKLQRLTHVAQNFVPQRIVFHSNRDGNFNIYVMDSDGGHQTRLTTNTADDTQPRWSPDGNQIAFHSYRANFQIYRVNADGSGETLLANSGLDWYARWSPDGNRIAFISFRDAAYELYVMNADGSAQTRLTTQGIFFDSPPEWSPNSAQILYAATNNGYVQIWKIDANGSNPTCLTSGNTNKTGASWSPNGSQIAYFDNNDYGLYVMNADGSSPSRLASIFGACSWSPDGHQIAFRSHDTPLGTYVINADGTDLRYLTDLLPDTVETINWSPDGNQLCFATSSDAIYLVNVDGSGSVLLTDNGSRPHWATAVEGLNDLAGWSWSGSHWLDGAGYPVPHGKRDDMNVVVAVDYNLVGQRASQRDPRGNVTQYAYDRLGRRIKLTDPLSAEWVTVYEDVNTGGAAYTGESRTKTTDPKSVVTQHDADRLGRLKTIDYGDAADTYQVTFAYNAAGSRESMTENNGTSNQRITEYGYDQVRRLTQVDFDTDGNGITNETVAYEYDLGGQRTRLTLPGNLSVTYTYDRKGRLASLTDWDGHQARFAHDNANRLIVAERASGLTSRYRFDAAGRLRQLRHTHGARTLAHFAYDVDQRGNRTRALELLAHPATTNDVTYAYDDASIVYQGTWAPEAATYMASEGFSASLQLAFFGPHFELTVGTGVNHSIFDVYVNGSLWQAFEGYAASSGERTISADLASDGPHILELRNRAEHSLAAQADASYDPTKFVVRFKQLVVANAAYDLRTLEYTYDALSRLVETRYNPGVNIDSADGDLLMRYRYAYDLAGNRTQTIVHDGTAEITTSYDYNAVNQLTGDGSFTYEYDVNGNLHYKKQGQTVIDTYTWDRANRLTSMGGLTYGYDGAGNRISLSNGVDVTQYLLDLQPGLPLMVARTTNGTTDRFVHLPGRGIFAQEDNAGAWQDIALDGLNSARLMVDDTAQVASYQSYTPVGVPLESVFGSPFTFTGELLDANALLYLRARYYSPALGVFPSLDPLENLNRYQYVGANPTNRIDPTGMFGWGSSVTEQGDYCYCIGREGGVPDGQLENFAIWLKNNNPSDAFMPGQNYWLYPGKTLTIPDSFMGITNINDTGMWKRNGCHCPESIRLGRCNITNNPVQLPIVDSCKCPEGQRWDLRYDKCMPDLRCPSGELRYPEQPCPGVVFGAPPGNVSPPPSPCDAPPDNTKYWVVGGRFEMSGVGAISTLDVNFERICGVTTEGNILDLKSKCGTFATLSRGATTGILGLNVGFGAEFGRISFPPPGTITYIYSVGADVETAPQSPVSVEGDFTITRDLSEGYLFLGIAAGKTVIQPPTIQGYVLYGATISLGEEWGFDNIPSCVQERLQQVADLLK